MKQRILYIFTAAVAIFSVFACSNEKMVTPSLDLNDDIQIKLVLPALTTKADDEATSNLTNGEKKVKRIDYFIFKTADYEAGNVASSYHNVITPAAADTLNGTYSVTLADQRTAILGQGATTGKVIAIANYFEEDPGDLTKDALDAMEAGNTFSTPNSQGYYSPYDDDHILPFIMRGDADITMEGGSAATGTVEMKRLASKITVKLVFPEGGVEDDNGLTWYADLGGAGSEARVYITNATSKTNLAGDPTANYFEYVYDYLRDLKEGEVPVYYTYPASTPTDDRSRMYIKVVVPWIAFDASGVEAKQMESYYKIVIPDADTETANVADVLSNLWYDITANIKTIGGGVETLIQASYIVKDWNNLGEISSNVASGNYLSLDVAKNTLDAYATLTQIAFAASGPVRARILNIYQYNYTGNTVAYDRFAQNNKIAGVVTQTLMDKKNIPDTTTIRNWVRIEGSKLVIEHAMQNDITDIDSFDAAPYVFEIELVLTDAPNNSYNKIITVTQYPAMYIVAEYNNGGTNKGDVYVNGSQSSNGDYGGVHGLTGSNTNPNMFVITSTILSDQTKSLGDPRLKTIKNYPGTTTTSWSTTGKDLYGTTNRGLLYYYPTDESPEAANVISPKFRFASSYGVTSALSDKNDAWRRCASYQEAGYPAGRWRLPTVAEIEYTVNLSANGFMAALFGDEDESSYSYYWAASGWVGVNYNPTGTQKRVITGTESHTGSTFVRCVYDEWYWSDKCTPTPFTWGDKTRTTD